MIRTSRIGISGTGLVLCALSCQGSSSPALPTATFTGYRQVVPGPGLPPGVVPDHANNNLDIVKHEGRIYFAFRTAPNHFASSSAKIYVLSSTDAQAWDYETEISLGADVREPRFVSFDSSLFLYIAQLGTSTTTFVPGSMYATRMTGPAQWTAPAVVHEPGFVPWRGKTIDGVPYLIGYLGGENEYNASGLAITVQVLTTTDGYTFSGVGGKAFVTRSGGSETDLAYDTRGNLFAIQRNEPGDDTGWGSRVCWGVKPDVMNWTCVWDPKKYDSPLMFSRGDDMYIIGRRNVTATGNYDLEMRGLTAQQQTARYLAEYSAAPKRCSLWRYDTGAHKIVFMMDLPSRGDTCYAGLVQMTADSYLLFNYTSPVDGPEISWMQGQLADTIIYSGTLTFSR